MRFGFYSIVLAAMIGVAMVKSTLAQDLVGVTPTPLTLTQNPSGGVMVSWDDGGTVRIDWQRTEEAVNDKDPLARNIARLMIAIRDGKYQPMTRAAQ